MSTMFIVGNGIGMAIDPVQFSLKQYLEDGWDRLDNNTKKFVRNITGKEDGPKTEDDLRHVQRACLYLISIGDRREIVNKIESYLAGVALQFFNANSNIILNTKLVKSLCIHLRQNKGSSVATLNYDKLLYGALDNENIFSKYILVDGFLKNGNELPIFNPESCSDKNKEAGWFMHLHGTPLYRGIDSGVVQKRSIQEIEAGTDTIESNDTLDAFVRHHLVLTFSYFKKGVIDQSNVLKRYWDEFENRVKNSTAIYCLGYSGHDPHVNELIRNSLNENDKQVAVLEWDFGQPDWYSQEYRRLFWQSKFNYKNIVLHSVTNINEINISHLLVNNGEQNE